MAHELRNGRPLGGAGVIEVKLRDVQQLFNSMDPSPFPEKDLDQDAEEFIVSWAMEHPPRAPLSLHVHLSQLGPGEEAPAAEAKVAEAIHTYFSHRREMAAHRLKQLLGRGRTSLIIGLLFLAGCLFLARLLGADGGEQPLRLIAHESLVIGGWVAMWRPMEIFLYDWWPLLHEVRVHRRLSQARVRIILPGG